MRVGASWMRACVHETRAVHRPLRGSSMGGRQDGAEVLSGTRRRFRPSGNLQLVSDLTEVDVIYKCWELFHGKSSNMNLTPGVGGGACAHRHVAHVLT